MGKPKILLVQLEFGTWAQAKAWAYVGNFAVEDGLRANGCDCVTLPALSDIPDRSPLSWLHHAKDLLAGQRFDQVWVWLVHNRYSDALLKWIAELAPVRVGLIMESLEYSSEDCRRWPHLRDRAALVSGQVRHMTHVLAADERDADVFNQSGLVQALFWPSAVPSRFITATIEHPLRREAAFYGELYGERKAWVAMPGLKDLLIHPPSAEVGTDFPQCFNALHQQMLQRFQSGWRPDLPALTEFVSVWRRLREAIFSNWLASLNTWSAIVNLPSLFQSYAGRVVEAMAAGRPVISWEIPDRPQTNALFKNGCEILLYPKDRPVVLKEHVERMARDVDHAKDIANAARAELLRSHTAEVRAREWLDWIETGQHPRALKKTGEETEIVQTHAVYQSASPTTNVSGKEIHTATTVFVLTVDDPVFAACLEAIHKQEGPPFTLDIIRNVCPFSAAAQAMIDRCTTPYFIQVDEDMLLHPDAVVTMEAVMESAPDDVGMICFHLYDDDREVKIQGVKIYRTALIKALSFRDLKASEMDLLEQMGRHGIRWILHPDVKGRHGTHYTIESIYRRYKTMYEKDIRQWNVLTADIRKKAERFRETGDLLQLFALLGGVHGIVHAPYAADREKNATQYDLHEVGVFKRLFTATPPASQPYEPTASNKPVVNAPIPFEQVSWKTPHVPFLESALSKPVAASPCSIGPGNSILIVTPFFWPSIGGVERVAEQLGVGLLAHGYQVDIATYPIDGRDREEYRGIRIMTVARFDEVENGTPTCILQVRKLIQSGRYSACLLLGAPMNKLFYGALMESLPADTRLFIQPTMNEEILKDLVHNQYVYPRFLQLAQQAQAVVALSEDGVDARFLRKEGMRSVYIPNGIRSIAPRGDFRQDHGIPPHQFLILHVANLYPVKNHLGLLTALNKLPSDVQLVMIGRPTEEAEYVRQVQEVLAERPDVLYVPGLDAEGIAAAMRAADVLVLASHSEASPLVVLEAMSCGLPWLATPGCGAVHEQAGGLVATISSFHDVLMRLKKDVDLRRQLGELGGAHWAASYDWSHVLRGWIELLTTGQLTASFLTPENVKQGMRALRRHRTLRDLTTSEDVGQPAIASAAVRPPYTTSEGAMDSDRFYVNLFVNAPIWSTPYPNADEAARWSKIASFLECILRRVRQHSPGKVLRILDVGCGRGWLTNLVSMYGQCEGVEPVSEVVAHARRLFPHLRFEAGTADQVLARPGFSPYDVVVSSEVLEHIPHGQKDLFLAQLASLLTPDGYLVLTTPRGEMWEQWKGIAPPNQPVEDWVTEGDLQTLFRRQGFAALGLERVHVEVPGLRYVPAPTPAELESMNLLPIYQVWACQRVGSGRPTTFLRRPKVSVIVPTYNRPDRLKEALQSILQQTCQDFEILVVNDGGTDVAATVAALNDGRITYIQHDRNRGLAASRNTGLTAASGTYIAYLDDDDRYLPNHLETLVSVLDQGEYKVAYTDAWRVHEQLLDDRHIEIGRDVPYSYDFNPAHLLVSNYFPVLCMMHRKDCLEKVDRFDESLYAHEDWDLWIRMATVFPFKHIKSTTAEFSWRTDGSSMTSATQATYWRTTEIIYRKYRPHAERIDGVLKAQQQRLEELKHARLEQGRVCSIVMPVCNRGDLTRDCLTALAGLEGLPDYELIVVDNGSTDGTADFLAQLGGDVRIITNAENVGFAKACNQGAAVAKGKYLVFLNNDTIPQSGWLNALVMEAEGDASVGIVGSKLLYPDGTIQHAGVVRDCRHLFPYHIYKSFAGEHPAVNQRREFQIVTAACLLIRRALFEEVGKFDEGYLNGLEDADLCLKVRERGYQVVYQPRSVVVHLESQTPGRKAHESENATRFLNRWEGQWWAGDEDRQFHVDGYKLKRIYRDGKRGGDIHPLGDIKDRAAWAHVAATQTAALKQDWPSVRRELALVNDWPDDPYVLSWGATVAERLQEPVYRAQFLARYVAFVDEPAKRLELIRMFLEQHNLPGAEEQLAILLGASPNHGEGLLLRGILCMQREQYEQAGTAFGSALQQGAERKKCLMGMGMAAMGRAYTQGAWERFLEVLTEYPDDAEAIHWLLRAGTAQNRWQELAEQLHLYTARNPGDLAARFAFTSVLLRGEQIEAARREYDALCKVDPNYDGLGQLGQAIAGREAALTIEAASS